MVEVGPLLTFEDAKCSAWSQDRLHSASAIDTLAINPVIRRSRSRTAPDRSLFVRNLYRSDSAAATSSLSA